MERKALGKGIGAFFVDAETDDQANIPVAASKLRQVPLHQIQANPDQPRRQFGGAELGELAASIRITGILQPILVVEKGKDSYQIVAGERRFRAAKLAGLESVPALVQDFSDAEIFEVSLLENIQRSDLNAIEEAQAFQKLIEQHRYTQEDLSVRLGKSRPYVTNSLRLLKLAEGVQKLIEEGEISAGHGRLLLALEDKEEQLALAARVVKEKAAVRDLELWLAEKPKPNKPKMQKAWNEREDLEKALMQSLQAPVKIEGNQQEQGWIKLKFTSLEEFNRIFKTFEPYVLNLLKPPL